MPTAVDDRSTTTAASTSSLSLSSSAHLPIAGDFGRGLAAGGALNGGAALDGGVLRGGDVVRLCHLTSAGFLTHEAVPKARRGLGVGGVGAGGEAGHGESVAMGEVRFAAREILLVDWLKSHLRSVIFSCADMRTPDDADAG